MLHYLNGSSCALFASFYKKELPFIMKSATLGFTSTIISDTFVSQFGEMEAGSITDLAARVIGEALDILVEFC